MQTVHEMRIQDRLRIMMKREFNQDSYLEKSKPVKKQKKEKSKDKFGAKSKRKRFDDDEWDD